MKLLFGAGCCVFAVGWLLALGAIGHGTPKIFAIGAILSLAGMASLMLAFAS